MPQMVCNMHQSATMLPSMAGDCLAYRAGTNAEASQLTAQINST